jgi:hypothetical protein
MAARDKPFLYVLNGEDPVAADDILAWCDWFEKADRVIKRTQIDNARVLTMFTGLDQAGFYNDQCVLWETTIFGGPHHGLGQCYTSKSAALVGHALWSDMARGEITSDHVRNRTGGLFHSDVWTYEKSSAAWYYDENMTWWSLYEVPRLLNVSQRTLVHYVRLGILHPRLVSCVSPRESSFTVYNAAEIITLCRRNSELPDRKGRPWYHTHADLPEQLKPSHAEILDHYVTPGVISLIEFRVRYGYQCKRFGKRYRVRRADETTVCIETSAPQAWKVSYRLEQGRLAPVLVVREAIAAGRILEAFQIVDQLSSDLAVPLRREITRATMPTELAAALEDQ